MPLDLLVESEELSPSASWIEAPALPSEPVYVLTIPAPYSSILADCASPQAPTEKVASRPVSVRETVSPDDKTIAERRYFSDFSPLAINK